MSFIPTILYKYRTWHEEPTKVNFHRSLLTNSCIYLACASQFNDPFDSGYPFRYAEVDMTDAQIAQKLIELAEVNWPHLSATDIHNVAFERQSTGIFKTDEYWKEFLPMHKKQMDEFGIYSLAANWDNILMWSHYADSHKGICVGLDTTELYEPVQGALRAVTYDTKFPELRILDSSPYEGLINYFYTKSTDWSYENEWRLIKSKAAKKLFHFATDAIKEIYLGAKMQQEDKNEIIELAKLQFPDCHIYELSIDVYQFKLNDLRIY